MSGESSSAAGWSSHLEPGRPAEDLFRRPDDPRLGDFIEIWTGNPAELRPGRPVLLGFPQDEGVRRNHGRPGAAEAPREIRRWLGRLSSWDGQAKLDLSLNAPVDIGNVRIGGSLEDSQQALGEVIGNVLKTRAVPIVLGGGHETAYGHFLGYVEAGRTVGIVNLDAHLDVRPCIDGRGHSGSPFRQALEHPAHPLLGSHYVCLGSEPHTVARQHLDYLRDRGGLVRWRTEIQANPAQHLGSEVERLGALGCQVYVTLDADVVRAADVPGVSAPNLAGLNGRDILACARLAGSSPLVSSFDLVEINPAHDRDGQSARWAAIAVWNFLAGITERSGNQLHSASQA